MGKMLRGLWLSQATVGFGKIFHQGLFADFSEFGEYKGPQRKIPGTKEGNPAIEEAIACGVAINVTLLFSREHYLASADAYMRGLERRIASGLSPDVRSVASVFLSRWDGATMDKVPDQLRDKLGIAIGQQTYKACSTLPKSEALARLGAGRF